MESKEPINNDLEDPDEEEMSEEEEEQIDPKVFLPPHSLVIRSTVH